MAFRIGRGGPRWTTGREARPDCPMGRPLACELILKCSFGRVHIKAALVQIQKFEVGGRASPFVVTTVRARHTSDREPVLRLVSGVEASTAARATADAAGSSSTPPGRSAAVGGSLRDVQLLAGHASLSTTQRYIEAHADAQRRIVDLV